jgi:sRNA-binding regulator protein Hfq
MSLQDNIPVISDDDALAIAQSRLTTGGTLHVPRSHKGTYQGRESARQAGRDRPRNKSGATGHEAFLKALVATGATVMIRLMNSDEPMVGVLKHTDKYTLTVNTRIQLPDLNEWRALDCVIYKHAIEFFCSLTARPEPVGG